MADKTFRLKIYTPKGLVLDTEAIGVSMPGIDGELGVLAEHTRYVGVLGAGMLEYQANAQDKPNRVVIAGGFASVQGDELIVLADAVDFEKDSKGINTDADIDALQQKLASLATFDPEWSATEQKIKRLESVRRFN